MLHQVRHLLTPVVSHANAGSGPLSRVTLSTGQSVTLRDIYVTNTGVITLLLHIKYLQSVLLVIILLHDNVIGSNLRRRKMLVRRKVAINRNIIARTQTNGTVLADEKQIKRPVKVIKRKILGSNSEPRPVISQLSLPPVLPEAETTTPTASILPQHKPFTVKETVPAKPDAVKRCRTKIYFNLYHRQHSDYIMFSQFCPCSRSCHGSRARAPPQRGLMARATPATSVRPWGAQPRAPAPPGE